MLGDLLRSFPRLLLPSAIDQTDLQGVVHHRIWRIAIEVRPFMVDDANSTSHRASMITVRLEGLFIERAHFLVANSIWATCPRLAQGKRRATPRLASIGGEAMVSA